MVIFRLATNENIDELIKIYGWETHLEFYQETGVDLVEGEYCLETEDDLPLPDMYEELQLSSVFIMGSKMGSKMVTRVYPVALNAIVNDDCSIGWVLDAEYEAKMG